MAALCWQRVLGVGGGILLLLSILSFPLLPLLINHEVNKRLVLEPGSMVYSIWETPTAHIPIYLQFYVWDVTNPDEAQRGGTPHMEERGPYTYREHRQKLSIRHHDNGTVSYRQRISYEFVREMSVGPETDTFTTVNLITVTVANDVQFESGDIQWLVSDLLSMFGERLFIRLAVRDIVWGYKDPLLDVASLVFPEWFTQTVVGVMVGRNDTESGVYTVYTGHHDISRLGIIDKYKGSSSVDFWTTSYANMINGTDGSMTAPRVTKSRQLYVFSPDICRSLYGIYNSSDSVLYDFPVYHFTAPSSLLANASLNPDNKGFCTPRGHCMGSGVLNISTCQVVDYFHLPLVVSLPHFLHADPTIAGAVSGLHPDPEQHRTISTMEPMTGIMISGDKRVQINAMVLPHTHIKALKDVSPVVLPILWMNESFVLDQAHLSELSRQLTLVWLLHVTQYSLLAVSVTLVTLSLSLCVYRRRRRSKQKDVADDTAPILDDSVTTVDNSTPIVDNSVPS